MGFQPFGTFIGDGQGNNRFTNLYVDSLWLSHEMRLMDKAAILSNNFVSGSAGFKISYDGSVEFNDVTIRGILEASLFRTASSGTRLEIDGSSNDTFVSFYDGATLSAMIGWEATGYGADTLSIVTTGNLDPIHFQAAGYMNFYADGDGGNSFSFYGDADGTIPGTIFRVGQMDTTTYFSITTQGQAQFASGSASLPGITFLSDTDTGMFRYSTNVLSFATAGTEWIRLSNVGAFRLGNKGTVGSPAIQFIADGDTGIYSSTANTLNFATGGAQALQLSSSQRAKFVDGSAAAPALTFINDTDTGIYRYGTNALGFTVAGSLQLRIVAGRILFPDGAATTPAMSFENDNNTGFYRLTGDSIGVTAGGQQMFRFREVSSRHYIDLKDVGELWWYNDGSYTNSGRRYRWWVNSADFDSFNLNVSSSGGAWSNEMRFVDNRMYLPATQGNTTGTAANFYIQPTSGVLARSTSARKYKSRITHNVDYLADIDLKPAKFYRKDDKQWFYGFIADDLGEQDRLLGEWDEDEIENYDQRAVMAVMAAKINRLERLLEVA